LVENIVGVIFFKSIYCGIQTYQYEMSLSTDSAIIGVIMINVILDLTRLEGCLYVG